MVEGSWINGLPTCAINVCVINTANNAVRQIIFILFIINSISGTPCPRVVRRHAMPGRHIRASCSVREIISIGGGSVGRLTLEPGWKWSQDVKPIAKTEWCEAPHFHYQASGRLHVVMQDGSEFESVAGDVVVVPSGHDAWVVGDEPVVLIDWHGATNYAKQ